VNNHRADMDQSTGEYLVTKDNVNAVQTLEKFDPEYQKARKMVPPTYPKRSAP
jgi:ribose transport system substrate-binding protein